MIKKIKWVGTLSTTERNNIGLIQVRQNNVNSEVLGFNIADGNGEPYDLKNRKVLFCTYFDKFAPVEQYAEVIEDGKIVYTMNEHDMQKPVRINFAYFKIMDEKDNLVDTTQNFSYDIIPSVESKCGDFGPYIIRLEEVLDAFLQINTDAKKELEQIIIDFNKQIIEQQQKFDEWFEPIRDILESVDPGGVLLKEIVGARGGEALLADRLNKFDSKIDDVNDIITYSFEKLETKFIGHRGASRFAPENTVASFELAKQLGFWGVECDINTTSDGQWVVIHDYTVDRTTDGSGNVNELTLDSIKKLTISEGLGNWNVNSYPNQKIMTLDEFLESIIKLNIQAFIEIKDVSDVNQIDKICNSIKRLNLEEKVIIISFSKQRLQKVREYNKKVKLMYISDITDESLSFCLELKNCGINPDYKKIDKSKVDLAHSLNVEVSTWTVNDLVSCQELVKMGVDYIASDKITGGVI